MDNTTSVKTKGIQVLFNENMWLQLLEIEDKFSFIEKFIEKDGFRVSDTSQSYRQINYLDNAGLLGVGRQDDKDKGWRIFKFRDMVYLNILNELRKFGVSNEQVRNVHTLFYEHVRIMDEVIMLCFMGVEMTLIFNSDGSGYILNPGFLIMFDQNSLFTKEPRTAVIRLTINDVVNTVLRSKKLPERAITASVRNYASEVLKSPKLTKIEKKILDVIRDKSYEQIKLKKKDGKPYVLYASSEAKSSISEQQLLADITRQSFSDVEIKKRDGKVVHYRSEQTIKL